MPRAIAKPEWSLRVSNNELRQREKSDMRKPQSIPPLTLTDEEAQNMSASEVRAAQQSVAALRSPSKSSTRPPPQRERVRSRSPRTPPARAASPLSSGKRSRNAPRASPSDQRSGGTVPEVIPVGEFGGHFIPYSDAVMLQGLATPPAATATTYKPGGNNAPPAYVYVIASPTNQHLEPDPQFPPPDRNRQPAGIRSLQRVSSPPRCRPKEEISPQRRRGTYSSSPARARSPSPKTGLLPGEADRLPTGWRAIRTPDGKLCYLHETSDRTEWTLPKDARPSTRSEAAQETLCGEPLPSGWRAIRTPNGLLCYVNQRGPNAVWTIPTKHPYRRWNPHRAFDDPTSPLSDILRTTQQEVAKYFPLPKRELDKPKGRPRRHSYTGQPKQDPTVIVASRLPMGALSPTTAPMRRALSPTTVSSLGSPMTSPTKKRRPSTPPPVLPEKPRLPSPLRARSGIKCNREGHKINKGLSHGPYGPPPFDDRTEYRVEYSPNNISTVNRTLDDIQPVMLSSPPHTEYRVEYGMKAIDDALAAGMPSGRQWCGNQESFASNVALMPPTVDSEFLAACQEVQAYVADLQD